VLKINGLDPNIERISTQLTDIYNTVTEIDEYLHSNSIWFGIAAPQTATDWGERTSLAPFRAISGNGVFGADANDEALVIGTEDTPLFPGRTHYSVHRMMVEAASNATPFVLRIIYGTGTMNEAQDAYQYTNFMMTDARKGASVPVYMARCISGQTKVWVRAKNATNDATVDFFIGLHTHEE